MLSESANEFTPPPALREDARATAQHLAALLAMLAFVKCELVSGQAAPARRSGCWRAEE